MRIIVAGSRTWVYAYPVLRVLDDIRRDHPDMQVISGMTHGADLLGHSWASIRKVPVTEMPADWSLGKSAGFRRNEAMAAVGDALIAFSCGTPGTDQMIRLMQEAGKPVMVVVHTGAGPQVVNLRDRPKDVIPVDRSTPLGNPYSTEGNRGTTRVSTVEYSTMAYAVHLRSAYRTAPAVRTMLDDLVARYREHADLRLGCWCAPALCHAFVVADVIAVLTGMVPYSFTGGI